MDICHVGDQHYVTLTDCGPSRYTIWRRISRKDSTSVIGQLESIFFERGAPMELLTDNAASFRSAAFCEFASRWGMVVRYRCAHVPSGNGVSERCHRSIKTIAARKRCSVAETVYRYNVMPRSDDPVTSPANQLFRYEVRLLDIDSVEGHDSPSVGRHGYSVGDRVWVRHPSRRCDVPSTMGRVTRVISDQNVEVDGMSRHVRDLRLVMSPPVAPEVSEGREVATADEDDECLIIEVPAAVNGARADEEDERDDRGEEGMPRRSERERRQTTLFQYGNLL